MLLPLHLVSSVTWFGVAVFLLSAAWLMRTGRFWLLPFAAALLALFSLRLTYASRQAWHMFDGTIPARYLAAMALVVLISGAVCWLLAWLIARRLRWIPRSAWLLGIAWAVAALVSDMEGCDSHAIHTDHRCPWIHSATITGLPFISAASAQDEAPPPAFMLARNRFFSTYQKCLLSYQDGRCEYELGSSFENAPGDSRNMREALSYYRLGAKKGHVAAAGRTGFFEVYGMAGPRNVPAALLLLNQAADQGDLLAQRALAEIYTKSQIALPELPPDPQLGLRWHMQLAIRGDANSAYLVAQSYATGGPLGQDIVRAIDFWSRAANAGHAQSWVELGKLFTYGGGVPTDPALGHALQVMGAEIGKPDFLRVLTLRAQQDLSAADKARAEALASAMRKSRIVAMTVSPAAISSFARAPAKSPNGLRQVDLAEHCKNAETLPDSFPVLAHHSDPYAWKCVNQYGAYKVVVVPEICLAQKPAAIAVLENPADARSWACVSAGTPVPPGLLSADVAAAPLEGTDDKTGVEWFERNFVRVSPRPFLNAGLEISRLRLSSDGGVSVDAWPIGWSLFGSNAMMLLTENLPKLKASQADVLLDHTLDQLQRESPVLSYQFSKHVLLRDYAASDAALARSLLGRGYSVWVAKVPAALASQLLRHSLTTENALVLLDKHSYLRAYTNPGALVPAERPAGTVAWLTSALGPYTAPPMPDKLPLAELFRRTSSAGKLALAPNALPTEITLPAPMQAQMRGLISRQTGEGRELQGIVIAGADGVPMLNSELLEQTGSYSSADFRVDATRLFQALTVAGPATCSGTACTTQRQWQSQIVGDFHTHPAELGFSSMDIRYAADHATHMFVSTPAGLQQLLVPTMALGGSHVGNYWAWPVIPLRMTAAYLEPSAQLGCQFKEQQELSRQAIHATALGMALYSGTNGVLRRVQLDAKMQAAVRSGHPLDLLFDGSGKLASPVDRLRIAIVARQKRQPSHLLDDLGPEDAFSPELSAATRALLGGKVNREAVELALWEHYAMAYQMAMSSNDIISGAPRLYFGQNNVYWMDSICDPDSVWGFSAQAIKANTFQEVKTERRAVLDKPQGDYIAQCVQELRIVEPRDAAGNRLIRGYCDNGLAREWINDAEGHTRPGSLHPLAPWKAR
ncbi:hypothetical protein GJ699_27020 [Duganella sp. FT80W]|uniref:Sel1 repeat family protein n=1 Tax=Duganella guangzhouensis TaxID=2666084 RepID=A0A6I2L644_9BURK|nr:tetratricopeptide repeat protein [Duganella guangzhouensis]MRW93651.1 hypothetical protein [Duganella guangzhouensis]